MASRMWVNTGLGNHDCTKHYLNQCLLIVNTQAGFEISNWMHLSVVQVDCKNHLSECTIRLSEIYKANATYVKIRNMQSSVGQVLQVFHLSDCHLYSSQTIGRVKFRTMTRSCGTHMKAIGNAQDVNQWKIGLKSLIWNNSKILGGQYSVSFIWHQAIPGNNTYN